MDQNGDGKTKVFTISYHCPMCQAAKKFYFSSSWPPTYFLCQCNNWLKFIETVDGYTLTYFGKK